MVMLALTQDVDRLKNGINRSGARVVKAKTPLEMFGYVTSLRTITSGSTSTMVFSHFAEVSASNCYKGVGGS